MGDRIAAQAEPAVDGTPAVTIADVAGCTGVSQLHKAGRYIQKELTHELAAGARRALQAGCCEADRRRLVSSAGHRATTWLRVVPTT